MEVHPLMEANQLVVQILSDGSVYFQFPQMLVVYCALDVAQFPFDTQKCIWSAGSFSHSSAEVRNEVADVNTGLFKPNVGEQGGVTGEVVNLGPNRHRMDDSESHRRGHHQTVHGKRRRRVVLRDEIYDCDPT